MPRVRARVRVRVSVSVRARVRVNLPHGAPATVPKLLPPMSSVAPNA